MKNLLCTIAVVLLALTTVTTYAQPAAKISKSAVFAKLPSNIKATEAQLNKFFLSARGQSVATSFDNVLTVSGNVLNNTVKYGQLQTITVKLDNYQGSILTVSKRLDQNNKPVYMAHIINNNSTDGYRLKRSGDSYQFEKINMSEVLMECAQ